MEARSTDSTAREPRLQFAGTEFGRRYYENMLTNEAAMHRGPLPAAAIELVKIRASQINGCGFCVDMHLKDAAYAGETAERLGLVAAWREAPYYSGAERAALALTEEATRLADDRTGVSDRTWEQVREHYDDEQIAALVAAIAQINAWNRISVTLRNPAGNYDPALKAARFAAAD